MVQVTPQRMNPRYKLSRKELCLTSSTGHLELFRIEPLHPGSPSFSARWDQKADTIDIDLRGSAAATRAFRLGIHGYRGHHAKIVSDSPRIYAIDIRVPEGPIFKGAIALIVDLSLML